MTNQITAYKLSSQQRNELEEKMRELLEFCQIYHVPFFVSCAVKNDDSETEYSNMVYSAQAHNMKLQNDRIRKYMLIANGEFDVVPKREIVAFDPFGVIKDE